MATRSKLAVILHADVAGSTTLVQMDERVAHERIRDAFQHCSEIISRYGGLLHELRGDALLAEFQRPSDAVTAALAIQAENVRRNERLTDDIRPVIRIGIALGEVVIADNTLTGPGVVLAQRLEQLAQPGGVCLQGSVHESVPKRFPFDYGDLGDRFLKGFDEPVRAFTAALKANQQIPSPEPELSRPEHTKRSKRRRLACVLVALSLVTVGILAWFQPWNTKPSSSGQPAIAVLPFSNLGADPQQTYFSEGMAEDIITDLGKLSGLIVIAANSSFFYRQGTATLREIGESLDASHVVRGTVRREGDRVRINMHLIETSTGRQIWGERYDDVIADVFHLQDKITSHIVTALAVHLRPHEEVEISRRETESVDAYDAFLQGWHLYLRRTPEEFRLALPHFERSVALDPTFRRAHAALAATYWEIFERGWHRALGISRREARKVANNWLSSALVDSPPPALALQVSSEVHRAQGQYNEAIADAERAVQIAPRDPSSLVALAGAYVIAGRPGDAVEIASQAMRLDPLYPAYYLYVQGVARFGLEQYSEAADLLRRASKSNSEDHAILVPLLATLGQLGRTAEANEVIERYAELRGWSFLPSVSQLAQGWPYKREEDRSRLVSGLLKAGVREH